MAVSTDPVVRGKLSPFSRLLRLRRLPLMALMEFTRSIRFSLSAGLMLREAMELLAVQGTSRVRRVAAGVARELQAGWSLHEALQKQGRAFPRLFLALTEVGEESGNLPEVMTELENFFQMQAKLRRDLWSELTGPIAQFLLAVGVIAGLIWILALLPKPPGTNGPYDPLGWGLKGSSGAVKFLVYVFGTVFAIIVGFLLVNRLLRRRALVEAFLLRLPLVGSTIRAISLTRVCMSLRLMVEAGLSILKSIRLAFAASDNAAFVAKAGQVEASLRRGNSIVASFSESRLFPQSFLSAAAVGENSGHLPEVLQQQGQDYDDLARRRLALLNRVIGGVIWLGLALFVATVVFRIFGTYADILSKAK